MGDRKNFLRIYFSTYYKIQHEDQVLAISGSIPELGNWDEERAVSAVQIIPHDPERWVLPLDLRPNARFEWKWVVISRKTKKIIRWEERSNRLALLQNQIWACDAPWNKCSEYTPIDKFPVSHRPEEKHENEAKCKIEKNHENGEKRKNEQKRESEEKCQIEVKHENEERHHNEEKNENDEKREIELVQSRMNVGPAGHLWAWSIMTWPVYRMMGLFRSVAGFILRRY